jgi:hypothetical protein
MGVLELHDPVPVIVPLTTVPLPVNSTKPEVLAATKSRFKVEPEGTGLEGTPIRTPCPVALKEVGSPVPRDRALPTVIVGDEANGPLHRELTHWGCYTART